MVLCDVLQEDEILTNMVNLHGPKRWSLIADSLEGRVGKQCRERWHNHLNPDVRKDAWAPEEDELIFELVDKLGTKWASISKHLSGRTDNSIKNRYYSSLKKLHELRKAGKDVSPSSPAAKSQTEATIPAPQSKKKHACPNPNPTFQPKRKRPSIASVAETELSSPMVVESSPWSTRSVSESSSDPQEENDDMDSTSVPESTGLSLLELPSSTIQSNQGPVKLMTGPTFVPMSLPVFEPSAAPLKLKIKRPSCGKMCGKSRANIAIPSAQVHHPAPQLPFAMATRPLAKIDIDEGLTEGFLSPSSPALSPTCSSFYGFEDTFHYNPSPEPLTSSPTINRFAPGPFFMATPPRTQFSFFQPNDFFESFPSMDLTPTMHSLPDPHDFDPHDQGCHAHHNDLPLQPLSLLCEYQLLLQKAN